MAGIATMKNNFRLYIWDEDKEVTAEDRVGHISQLGDVGGEAEDIDVTTLESMAKEYINGFDDNGTLDITQNMTSNEYVTMDVRKKSGKTLNWGISVFNNQRTKQILGLHGKGIIKSAKLTGISVGGLLQVVSSLRVSGAVENNFIDPTGPNIDKPVTGITVTGMGGETTIATKGGKLQLIATVTPADASVNTVKWSVDKANLATISSTGELTAKANGTVIATATAEDGSGVNGTLSVTITGQE